MDRVSNVNQSSVTAAGQVQEPVTLPADVPAGKGKGAVQEDQSNPYIPHVDAMHHLCKHHMHHYVQLHTSDNQMYSGIITYVDDQYVHLSQPVPVSSYGYSDPYAASFGGMWAEYPDPRAYAPYGGSYPRPRPRPPYYGYGGYGYPGYGYGYPSYGYGYNPIILPLATLVALSLIPW